MKCTRGKEEGRDGMERLKIEEKEGIGKREWGRSIGEKKRCV